MVSAFSLNRFWELAKVPKTSEFYLLVAIISFCFLCLFFIMWKVEKKRKRKIDAPGQITDESTIRMMLQEAVEQRCTFEIQTPSLNRSKRPTLCCRPYYLGINVITLEVVGLKTLSRSWKNGSLDVYFRLTQKKSSFAYFVFLSTIQSISTPTNNTCLITLPIPQYILCSRQKRSSLRILPPQYAIKGAAFWYGKRMPLLDKINDIALWPNPLFFSIKDKLTQFSIEDISNGGIRLSFSQQLLESLNIQFSATDQFLLMLDLKDVEPTSLLRVWLHCKIQRVISQSEGSKVIIGAKFESWARPKVASEENSSIVEWLRTSFSQEVEVLTNWTLSHQIKSLHDYPEAE